MIASLYKSELEQLHFSDKIDVLVPREINSSSYWKVPIILDKRIDRADLTEKMNAKGISVDWAYNPPLHLQPVFINLYKTYQGQLPITEGCLNRHVCLPCHPGMTEEDTFRVIEGLRNILTNY